MSIVNTSNFLPSAFRSETNQRFLGATMDQLIVDSRYDQPISGYIGRTFAPTYKLANNYVPEINDLRKHYQLEASAVVKDADDNILLNSSYNDLLASIKRYQGYTSDHQRLFKTESYNYNGHFDYDKFVNYHNYFWMPDGPAAIGITATSLYSGTFTFNRSLADNGYVIPELGTQPNPQIILARGGSYTFAVNQPGVKLWIQSAPGVTGQDANIPNANTRQIAGVSNNGTDAGVITINVPLESAQDFYIKMPTVATVNAAVEFDYTEIQNTLLSEFLNRHPDGLDGINSQLNNKTFIFITHNNETDNWATGNFFDGQLFDGFDGIIGDFDTSVVVPQAQRRGVWKVLLTPINDIASDFVIQVVPETVVSPIQKVFVASGNTNASSQYWVDTNYQYNKIDGITAPLDYLYYQDSNNPNFFGTIKLNNLIDIEKDILGSMGYVSPNGVMFTNGLKVRFDSSVVQTSYANRTYYVDGVGTAITLTPADKLVVPESYGVDIGTAPDYITINRGSADCNPWSRYNRWFHRDALAAAAEYNGTAIDYGPNIPGRRPIIEFDANLQLVNFGNTTIDSSIDLISFASTDAFTTIEGHTTATLDGVALRTGMRVIFANDYDINVKNRVWTVSIDTINFTNFVRLVDSGIAVESGQSFIPTQGTANGGKTFHYTGTAWVLAQSKTAINQSPLFDLFDANGYSFSDTAVYPGTTFVGTKAFDYKRSTNTADSVLGFGLSYQTFNNIGDIVFLNYYDTDKFTYTPTLGKTETVDLNSGYFSIAGTLENNWVATVEPTEQYQIFTKFHDGTVLPIDGAERVFLQIDVLPETSASIPYLKVYLNNVLLTNGADYYIASVGVHYVIAFLNTVAIGDKLDALVFSNSASALGYYEVPENLDLNPLNETFSTITLGQIRKHYTKLVENTVSNKPPQDSYLRAQGGTIMQHRAPAIYASVFLTDPDLNFVNSVDIARREYTRFKNQFLTLCDTLTTIDYTNPVTGVDTILETLNAVKNNSFPWYYSDMVPQGRSYSTITYPVLNARQSNYEISSIFDNTVLSNQAITVYVNNIQQILGRDYTFSKLIPAITFLKTLTVGQVIAIREYNNTDGNYVPETPSKLGLYPKFAPEIFTDSTYQTPTDVIRGHDGSLTPVFGDFRDNYLLELESRIYNNIKTDYSRNTLNAFDTIPGRFRSNDYSLSEFIQLLSRSFLQWTGSAGVDFSTNSWFDSNNPWTFNYAATPDNVDGTLLQGSWRAIYYYWYDTDRPNTAPWEMLGFSSKPLWWETRYGPAPYTGGNSTLWQDLEAGYIWNNGNSYTEATFARPGLSTVIPLDSAGNLIPPLNLFVGGNLRNRISNIGYAVGNQGPAETAWRRSSDYPYAVQLALALAKPAEYFATQIDSSRFYKNPVTGQFTDANNAKINNNKIVVNGDTTTGTVLRASGYINWIADAVKNLGIDPVSKINQYTKNLSVQLSYSVGGFTDQNLITVYAEQTSPGSTNDSVVIPDTNYKVHLNKSAPIGTMTYSAVVVQKTGSGYQVRGYDLENPFFTILPSIANGNYVVETANQLSAKIYLDGNLSSPMAISYGTEFATPQQLVDFLISYERYLKAIGFSFTTTDTDLNAARNFALSSREFLYWAEQGWKANNLLILNPVVNRLVALSTFCMVDEIDNSPNGGRLLDQNFRPIGTNNFTISRDSLPIGSDYRLRAKNNNGCSIAVTPGTSLCLAKLNLVRFEHSLVFDNQTDFGDIIYVPAQGTRQFRLKLAGRKSGFWTGALSAPGYIYSNPTIVDWKQHTDYQIGTIVKFSNSFYTAKKNLAATAQFDFSSWTQIDESSIQTGLLPSFGHNAQKFEKFYDVDNPPSEENLQLASAGLIGFRPRPYFTDLGMSISNQTKFYQGFVKQKGTQNALSALTKAQFDNVESNIVTYEEWAFRVGQYGDLNSNQYREFVVDQSVYTHNPVAFVYSNGNITANITSPNIGGNLYTSSNIGTIDPTIYNNRAIYSHNEDLPTAGYVNIDDINSQIFDINTVNYNDLAKIEAGQKVWVVKDTNNTWNVFRISDAKLTAVSVSYALDSYGVISFNNAHNFNKDDLFLVSGFVTEYGNYNDIYKVVNVPDRLSVTVVIKNSIDYLAKNSPLRATGKVQSLLSMRLSTINDIQSRQPIGGWHTNDRVWVDNSTAGGWGVYTYTPPNSKSIKIAHTASANARFGTSVKISSNAYYVYASSPGTGQVYANGQGVYSSSVIANTDPGFGKTISAGGNVLAVASDSRVHVFYHQANTTPYKLTTPTITTSNIAGNISSIAVDSDGKWIYIGGNGFVEAYTLSSNVFVYANTIVGQQGLSFGKSIAVAGNIIAVGAPAANITVTAYEGIVVPYARSGNVFTKIGSEINPHDAGNYAENFGAALALDSTGGNLFIGAPGHAAANLTNGTVEWWQKTSGGGYTYKSTLLHPLNESGTFGSSISVSSSGDVLAVGGKNSPTAEVTTFDSSQLTIDTATTIFIDTILNSGAVYLFESLNDQSTLANTLVYNFSQKLSAQVYSNDDFGSSIDVSNGLIAVGASTASQRYANLVVQTATSGTGYTFAVNTQVKTWSLTRQQPARVDINSIDRTFIYNKKNNNILATVDFVDPVKGKVLGSVGQDIDYRRETDPALYNQGTGKLNRDQTWTKQQVGRIWWNLSNLRYIDYEQGDLDYRIAHWNKTFPGSSIDVYEWVESDVLPSGYTANGGQGFPAYGDDSRYSTMGYVDPAGNVKVKYYFWVQGLNIPNSIAGKKNSVLAISTAIQDPRSQNVPYIEVLRDDAVAIYNVNQFFSGVDSVLHLGSRSDSSGLIHSEYTLVQEGNPLSPIPPVLLSKLIDSLAGEDYQGNLVPDTSLPIARKYGINIRPRQSMFVDRMAALENYFVVVNKFLLEYPVVERKVLTKLNSGEATPNILSGEFDQTINTYDELSFIDTTAISNGYKVLVDSDVMNGNKWAIYAWASGTSTWAVTRIQSYKTNQYWTTADWYDTSYDPTVQPNITVANRIEFGKLTLVADTYVKIINVGDGNFAVYYIDNTLTANLVGIQNGTIQVPSADIPAKELRQILLAFQTEIFINDIASEYNKIFFYMIKYALTEQKNLDWVFKTSFISATQSIRKLKEFPAYIADNQNYYLDYINEVKPYRTVLREFVVDYIGNDTYGADITDFDLPAYWDANLSVYRGPTGEQSYDANLLTSNKYSQWSANYRYSVVNVTIVAPGTGYYIAPEITFLGGGGTGATGVAVLANNGSVASITITNPGTGYTSRPLVKINGVGTGARATADINNIFDGNNTGHNLIRSINTTMKFDRIEYTQTNNIVFWSNVSASDFIPSSTIIVHNGDLYKLNSNLIVNANIDFPLTTSAVINYSSIDNANDRIIAYAGNVNLANYLTGIEYPGVLVGNTAANNFRSEQFDSTISSGYIDPLGTSASDITIDGGAYYDRYSSHAPEEMIPGRIYDTLDLRVFNTVGNIATRTFTNMQGSRDFYRIANANTTTLASDLLITDTVIHVVDAGRLPVPNTGSAMPGEVIIGGEKIVYYTRDIVTNTLGQLRRAVDGTGAPAIHTAGTRVVDASAAQSLPNITKGSKLIEHADTPYITTQGISIALTLSGNITANVGDTLMQLADTFPDPNYPLITLNVLESVANATTVACYIASGAIQVLPDVFDDPAGFDVELFDHTAGTIYIQPFGQSVSSTVSTGRFSQSTRRLGTVETDGTVIVPVGTVLETANIVTAILGNVVASNYPAPIITANTVQTLFLNAGPGYLP